MIRALLLLFGALFTTAGLAVPPGINELIFLHPKRAPDLIGTSISYDQPSGNFTSIVKNQGQGSTPTGVVIGVAYFVDNVKCTWGVVNGPLAAGASVTIGTNGGACTIAPGTHTITVLADDVNRIQESNENNNLFSQQITIGGGTAVTIASLTAHNTSAFNAYNQTNFPVQFGTDSFINNSTTVIVDPAKMDLSMNASTPVHVSNVDVHTLIPSRLNLRWFAHLMAGWFGPGAGPTNAATGAAIASGYTGNSDAYVAALIPDLMRRGFNGVFVVWNGINSPADQTGVRIKNYIAANVPGQFNYAILIDEGLVDGKTAYPATGAGSMYDALVTAVNYLNTTYFSDPNYEKEAGKAFLPMYGVGDKLTDAGMNAAKTAVGSTSSWGHNSTAHIGAAWCDVSFDWTEEYNNVASPGYLVGDPYNLAAVGGFYTAVAGVPAKHAMGAMTAGFNGTVSGVGWSLGKYLPQQASAAIVGGGALIARANSINARLSGAGLPNVTRMQWVTWNDYPEGSAVEPGIENDVTVTAGVQGSTLNWTYTSGTGDESTIDHYEVYASTANINAAYLGSVPAGVHSFPLGSSGLTSGAVYHIIIVAVGKPCIRDHVNNNVTFTAP